MGIIGKTIHISIDLLLVSTALAGIKRNTGLTLKDDVLGKDIQPFVLRYLNFGETAYDSAVGAFSASDFFKRR